MKIKLDIPEATSGNWKIDKFTVSESDARFANLRQLHHQGNRFIVPGDYLRLMHNLDVVMSNVPSEINDHIDFIRKAKGNVLINGLGLGMVIKAIIENVDKITVIEKSKDVINLVSDYYQDDKINIINEDAFLYKPPKNERYDYVWHDIWTFITPDNLKGMEKLHRKYGKRTDWQGSWCKDLCKAAR